MPITTPQGFDLQMPEPLEIKTIQPTTPDGNTLSATRYDGLTIYVTSTSAEWQWRGSSWIQKVTDGFSASWYLSTGGNASDEGHPILLGPGGKIDASMLTASNLDLYYLLDGTKPLEGNMSADGQYKITGLVAGTTDGDSVRFEQLANYLTTGETAADSDELGGELPSFYLDVTNLSGVIDNANLPASIDSDITGNASTSTRWAAPISITLQGVATSGATSIDGSAHVFITTFVSAGDVTGGASAYNKSFTTSGGDNGILDDVARGDHTHPGTTTGYTGNTTWKDKDSGDRYGKFSYGVLKETGAWVPMTGFINETTVQGQDTTIQDVTINYVMDPLVSTGYTFQYKSGSSIVMSTTGATGTGNTTATVLLAGSVGLSTVWQLMDNYTGAELDTVTIEIIS